MKEQPGVDPRQMDIMDEFPVVTYPVDAAVPLVFHRGERHTLYHGDCVGIMRSLEEDSVDSIVTDPPYGLEFMGKEWDRLWNKGDDAFSNDIGWGVRPAGYKPRYIVNRKCCACGRWARDKNPCQCEAPQWQAPAAPKGDAHMMRRMQAWHLAWATEALRVLKPGGHLLAFGGTRTYHRLTCALEDAGFEIRDSIAHFHSPRTEGVIEAWLRWSLDNAGIRFREPVDGSAPEHVLLSTSLESSPAHALIAELRLNEARLTDAASWRSALSDAGEPTTESSALVSIAGPSQESRAAMSGGDSTVLDDAPAWLAASRWARTRAAAALRIWLGSGPSLKRAATDALCVALTDALKAITCAQSETFQSYDTTRQMVCVSATTATTTVSTAVNLLAFTAAMLEVEEGGDAAEVSTGGPLAWVYGSGFP